MGKKKKDPSLKVIGENMAANWGVPGAHHRRADGKFTEDPIKKMKKRWMG